MLIVSTGRERTLEEYTELLAGAWWTYRQTWYPASTMLGVVEDVHQSRWSIDDRGDVEGSSLPQTGEALQRSAPKTDAHR